MKHPQGEPIRNPGPFLNLTDKCKNVFPVFYDGLQVNINRVLGPHLKVSHAIYLSSITPGNYRLGVTYVGNKRVGPHDGYPVLTGDIDCKGNMNASIYHLFGWRLKVRFDGQMMRRSFTTSQLTAHYCGDTFTASALLVNPNLIDRSGFMILQYLQNVTSSLALGVELAYLTPKRGSGSQVGVVARYSTQHTMWAANVNLHNVQLSCYSRASEQMEFGVELDTNLREEESVGSLAYKVTLKERGITFRASLDTNSNVGSVFETHIFNSPFALSFSANLNHRTNNFRLGFGFIVN